MANSYSAPNFNIDTNCTLDDLWTLKGSAPAYTDYLYIAEEAEVTQGSGESQTELQILQIILGEFSSGAATASKRYGKLTIDKAGFTIKFAGDASSRQNSGIWCDPASADASSLKNMVTLTGTSGSGITLQNQGGAFDDNEQWCCEFQYGLIALDYVEMIGAKDYFILARADSTKTDATELQLDHVTITDISGNDTFLQLLQDATIPVYIRDFAMTGTNASSHDIMLMSGGLIGGIFDGVEIYGKVTGTSEAFSLFSDVDMDAGKTYYFRGLDWHIDEDSLPPTTLPTNFAVTDQGSGGDLLFSWDNGASYRSKGNGDAVNDMVFIYDNSDDSIVGVALARDGSIEIGGFTDGVAFTAYAKASSDGYYFTSVTSTDSATPTAGTTPTFDDTSVTVTDNQNGTLQVSFDAGTDVDHYEISVHTSSMGDAATIAAHRVACVDEDSSSSYSIPVCALEDGTVLSAGTTYYVNVQAVSSTATADGNTTNVSKMVTDPHGGVGYSWTNESVAVVPLQTTETTIYECPTGSTATVFLILTNVDSSSRTFQLHFRVGGVAAADANLILPKDKTLEVADSAGDTEVCGPVTMEAGDIVSALASANDVINVHVSILLQGTT